MGEAASLDLLEPVTFTATSQAPYLQIAGGAAPPPASPPQAGAQARFAYAFFPVGGSDPVLQSELPAYPTTERSTPSGPARLRQISLLLEANPQAVAQAREAANLLTLPVDPPTLTCQVPAGTSGNTTFAVLLTGPDSFFTTAYNSAPNISKAQVRAGSSTHTVPTAGVRHEYPVPDGAGVAFSAPLLVTRETVSGQNLTYRYAPNPDQATFTGLNPLLPQLLTVVYTLRPGELALEVTGLPSGATWGADLAGQGRYATLSLSLTGLAAPTASRTLPPGIYTVAFAGASRTQTVTLGGTPVTFTERYPITPSPQTVPLSSEGQAQVRGTVGGTPLPGTLTVSRTPTSLPVTIEVYNAAGNPVATVNLPAWQASASLSLPAGAYRVVAPSVQSGGDWYDPTPGVVVVGVSSGGTAQASFAYEIRPSTIEVRMTGLPEGVPTIQVTEQGAPIATLRGSGRVQIRPPAGTTRTYAVLPQDTLHEGRLYVGTATPASFPGRSGGYTYTVQVVYRLVNMLTITFVNPTAGTPFPCTNGTVTLRRGTTSVGTYGSTVTLRDIPQGTLPDGTYTLSTATPPSHPNFTCVHDISPSSVALSSSTGEFTVTVRPTTGALRILLRGYPRSTFNPGDLTVTGPTGATVFHTTVASTSDGPEVVYRYLSPGTYTVQAVNIPDPSGSGLQFVPSPSSLSLPVRAGEVTRGTITYTLQLPPGAGSVRVRVACNGGACSTPPLVCSYVGQAPSSLSQFIAACRAR